MPTLLDANIAIRYFTQDDPAKAEACRTVIEEVADGKRTLRLIEAVFVEIVQVLTSKVTYNLPRAEVATKVADLIRLPGILLARKPVYLRALELWVQVPQLSIVDALIASYAEQETEQAVLTYDTEFRRVRTVTAEQPTTVESEQP